MVMHTSFGLLYFAVGCYLAALVSYGSRKTSLSWETLALGLAVHTAFQIGLARRGGQFFPCRWPSHGTGV